MQKCVNVKQCFCCSGVLTIYGVFVSVYRHILDTCDQLPSGLVAQLVVGAVTSGDLFWRLWVHIPPGSEFFSLSPCGLKLYL